MNTEILNTLQAVQQARLEATMEMANPDLTNAEARKLEPVVMRLRNMENALINQVKDELVTSLTQDAEPLRLLTEEIMASVQKLERVAAIVQRAAEKVEALIKVVGIATKAGLI